MVLQVLNDSHLSLSDFWSSISSNGRWPFQIHLSCTQQLPDGKTHIFFLSLWRKLDKTYFLLLCNAIISAAVMSLITDNNSPTTLMTIGPNKCTRMEKAAVKKQRVKKQKNELVEEMEESPANSVDNQRGGTGLRRCIWWHHHSDKQEEDDGWGLWLYYSFASLISFVFCF